MSSGGAVKHKAAISVKRRKHTSRLPDPGPYQCHPGNKVHGSHGCMPLPLLQRVAAKLQIADPGDGKLLRDSIEKALHLHTAGEHTFLKALPITEEEKQTLSKTLRPVQPAGWKSKPNMWLDSNDITNVLNQWEESNPECEIMGPFPIDFAAPDPYKGGGKQCLITEVCGLRITQAIANGTTKIGIVYNLDPHFKSGSHWVANYIDIPGHVCYYFDSYGMRPPQQISKFMKWLTVEDPQMRLEYNARRLQYKDTECGVYCIEFIVNMILGSTFKEFTHRNPTDDDMLKRRGWNWST